MSSQQHGIRVLHVDDEPDFADLASTFLSKQDDILTVDTATSVDEGLSRLQENSIDCVVSDFDMPAQNGIDFLKTVREDHPDLPFVLFTGKGSEEVASEAISAGVTEYLQKESGTDQYAVLANRITNVVSQYDAERRAAKMTRRLDAILENTTTPMFMKDVEGVYLLVNQGFKDLFDLEHDGEIVGHTDHDLFSDDEISPILAHDRRVIQSGESITVEERVPVNGDERVFLSSKVPIYDIGTSADDDSPVALFGVAKDITDLKARERELTRHRDLLEHTEHLAATGGWEANVETCYQRWTDGTYAIHDLEPDGAFDPTVDSGISFYHPDDQASIASAVERCMELGEPYEVELRLITNAGRERWVRASGDAIESDGEIVAIRGAIQDITDLKEREAELQRQNKRLDEFVNVVSHDLRNPISVAKGRLELARTEGETEHFEAVARAHDRMDRIIDDLLELAISGAQAPDLEPVSLAEAVERSQQYVDFEESMDVRVSEQELLADRSQLEHLIRNLISNAVEHGGADVTITVGDIVDGWYLEDDGPGIPADLHEQVFDSGFTTKTDGTGFGLDVVKQVIAAHEWSIRLTDSEAGGARFEITDVDIVPQHG